MKNQYTTGNDRINEVGKMLSMEIIRKLKKENRILIICVVILSLLLSGMVIRYKIIPMVEGYYIVEQVAEAPRNVDIPKRKTKKGNR